MARRLKRLIIQTERHDAPIPQLAASPQARPRRQTIEETKNMIEFRCHIAQVKNPFEDSAIEAVYNYSKGVPREVIKICAMSVQYAMLNELVIIPKEIVEMAQNDVVADPQR